MRGIFKNCLGCCFCFFPGDKNKPWSTQNRHKTTQKERNQNENTTQKTMKKRILKNALTMHTKQIKQQTFF